jgi:hypothetical protein
MTSLLLSEAKTPEDRTVKENTAATTIKAIRRIAVSKPEIPVSLLIKYSNLLYFSIILVSIYHTSQGRGMGANS